MGSRVWRRGSDPRWPTIEHGMGAYRFAGRDGVQLACLETGSGRPLVLLHGFMGAGPHMLSYSRVGGLAEQGYRLIVPDLRGHGDSAKLHDPAAYPPDVLADDGLALVGHLGLGDGDYDLGGYSLGGRVVVRMLVRGAKPGRAIVAGQGLAKVSGPQGGGVNHRVLTALAGGVAIEPGSPDAQIAHWISELSADPVALLHVLNSLVPTPVTRCARSRFRRSSRSARRMSALMPTSWPRSCAMPGSSACRAIMAAPSPRPSSPPRSPRSSPNADAGAERRGLGRCVGVRFRPLRRACCLGAAGIRARTCDRTG